MEKLLLVDGADKDILPLLEFLLDTLLAVGVPALGDDFGESLELIVVFVADPAT